MGVRLSGLNLPVFSREDRLQVSHRRIAKRHFDTCFHICRACQRGQELHSVSGQIMDDLPAAPVQKIVLQDFVIQRGCIRGQKQQRTTTSSSCQYHGSIFSHSQYIVQAPFVLKWHSVGVHASKLLIDLHKPELLQEHL